MWRDGKRSEVDTGGGAVTASGDEFYTGPHEVVIVNAKDGSKRTIAVADAKFNPHAGYYKAPSGVTGSTITGFAVIDAQGKTVMSAELPVATGRERKTVADSSGTIWFTTNTPSGIGLGQFKPV
jgi:hypothetical protein